MKPSFPKVLSTLVAACCLVFLTATIAHAQTSPIRTPSQFLGFQVGADQKLADYKQIASYFKMLAGSSKKIEIEVLGPTHSEMSC